MATRRARPGPGKAPAAAVPNKQRRGRNAAKTTITVDFTDVEAGGGMPTPDGLYVATISSAEKEVSQAGNDMIVVRWKTNIGSTVFDRFVLVPQSLWVLRTALNCMGFDTPDDEFSFELEDMVGQECGIEITNEEYEEKDQPRVTGYLPSDQVQVEGAAKPKAKPKARPAKQEEPDDDGEEEEEEAPAPRRKAAPAPKASPKKRAAPPPDEEEEGSEEEAEEEDAPARRVPKKKAAASGGALRPGARVTFPDESGDAIEGVIEALDGDMATVVDDEDGEWDIPINELTKA